MTQVKIFSDTTCDLAQVDIALMDIGIVPLTIAFGQEIYTDTVDITTESMLEMAVKKAQLPKTAAPSIVTFVEMFQPYVAQKIPIIYIGIHSLFSSTLANARLAAAYLEGAEIYIVDSLNISGGIGALIRMAHRMQQKELPVDEIAAKLEEIAPNYKIFLTMDKLDFLHMGGRCGGLQYLLGSVLGIRPIIKMAPQGLEIWKKVRSRAKAIDAMMEQLAQDKDDILFCEIHIASIVGSEDFMSELATRAKALTGIGTVHHYPVGCTIASHCGQGTFGFGYFLKSKPTQG